MAHAWAPFAILPIFVALERIDRSLLEDGARRGGRDRLLRRHDLLLRPARRQGRAGHDLDAQYRGTVDPEAGGPAMVGFAADSILVFR